MKRALLLAIVLLSWPVFGQGPVSPCYWSGTVTKCFPAAGIQLSSGQALELGDYVGDLVSVQAASPTATYVLTLPAVQGGATTVPQNDGSGNLSWISTPVGATYPVPFASTSGVQATITSVPAASLSGVSVTASTGGVIAASPTTGNTVITAAGTSGGVPYFSNAGQLSSSALLAKGAPVLGGGAAAAPTTLATGGGVLLWNYATQTPSFGAVNLGSAAAVTAISPTQQKFTSGTGTYTAPAGVVWIRVRMIGGGGGGAGSGTVAPTNGSDGAASTFGATLLVANNGKGGNVQSTSAGGAGGTASLGSGPVGLAISGGVGSGAPQNASVSTSYEMGGMGAASAFGGGGGTTAGAATGTAAAANTGAGGGGGSCGVSATLSFAGPGGGAGGFIDAIIASPASTYGYAVGAGGSGGSAGSANGNTGGAGGSGVIIVEEHYY